jgi:hypothetical protein
MSCFDFWGRELQHKTRFDYELEVGKPPCTFSHYVEARPECEKVLLRIPRTFSHYVEIRLECEKVHAVFLFEY